jgi:short-subunit dehydrogenase
MTKAVKPNSWAVVTGASSGIGHALASELARRGHNIVAIGRRPDALNKTCQAISKAHDVQTRSIPLDLLSQDAIGQIEDAIEGLEVDIVVSNAGADAMGAVLAVEVDALRTSLHLNTRVHLEIVHFFGRRFVTQGRGRILLVSSIAGQQGTPYMGNYAGSKAYILNLGMAMNYELRRTNVGVTVLMPGPTRTPGVLDRTDIPLANLPGPLMDPVKVARVALDALERGRPYVVPGGMNKVLVWISRFLGPRFGRDLWGLLMSKVVPERLAVTAHSRFR